MARINVARFGRLAGEALGVKGQDTLGFVENSIFATFPVDASAPFEYWKSQGLYRYSVTGFVAAVAGQYPGFEIHNDTPNSVLVVERIFFKPQTSGRTHMVTFNRAQVAGVYPNAKTPIALDSRVDPFVFTSFIAFDGTLATNTPGTNIIARVSNSSVGGWVDYPAVVGYSDTLFFTGEVVNETLAWSVEFHVREALPDEL